MSKTDNLISRIEHLERTTDNLWIVVNKLAEPKTKEQLAALDALVTEWQDRGEYQVNTCEWRYSTQPNLAWETTCINFPSTKYDDWIYCPYCRGKIKEMEE